MYSKTFFGIKSIRHEKFKLPFAEQDPHRVLVSLIVTRPIFDLNIRAFASAIGRI